MKLSKLLLIGSISLIGCAHCGSSDEGPYIRTQPGIEYCGDMCDTFKSLKCTGYYEDIIIDCSKDPVYAQTMNCNDAGMLTLTCKEFCEYEMKNSVQLDPKCFVDNLLVCSEIETVCK